MSTRGIADVVFCLDASESMAPCFAGVVKHLNDFVSGLMSDPQVRWDLRMDFVAHRAGESSRGTVFQQQSLYNPTLFDALYGVDGSMAGGASPRFFTNNVQELARGMSQVAVKGDEAPLVGLDSCLDFPWRESSQGHRVVIFMTDEPFETGVFKSAQMQVLPQIQKKIQQLRVILFIVGPESEVFNRLAQVEKSEYEVVDGTGDGLSRVDFSKVLSFIGKSVSMPLTPGQGQPSEPVTKGLFGQQRWASTQEAVTGR